MSAKIELQMLREVLVEGSEFQTVRIAMLKPREAKVRSRTRQRRRSPC